MPTIATADGFRYELTSNDLDWASRMNGEEGGNAAANLWTMAQRFAMLRPGGSFASFIRAYSQPINPKWLASGEFCRAGGRYAGTDPCDVRRLERRAHAQNQNTRYPAERAYVELWARGGVPNPVPAAVHFADPSVSSSCLHEARCTQTVMRDGNWYMTAPGSADWDPDFVTIDGVGTAGYGTPVFVRDFMIGVGIGLALVGIGIGVMEQRA